MTMENGANWGTLRDYLKSILDFHIFQEIGVEMGLFAKLVVSNSQLIVGNSLSLLFSL